MRTNTQTPTLVQPRAQSEHLFDYSAARTNKGSCPCIILASLLVTYPDFYK